MPCMPPDLGHHDPSVSSAGAVLGALLNTAIIHLVFFFWQLKESCSGYVLGEA